MMKFVTRTLLTLCTLLPLSANNNLRHWNLTDGSRMHAELVDYNEETNQVYLRINETKDHYLKLEDFSPLDQAWLVEWTRMSGKLMEMLEKMPGKFTAFQYQGELDTHDFYVYEPSSVQGISRRPLMILINAGPKGMRYLLRHMEAAEATSMTIIAMDRYGNSHTIEEAENNLTRFLELLPQIEATVAHDPQQIYIGGISGGALRAINWANAIERPWKGVYWNGGWLGYDKNLLKEYRKMKVIVVNGNNDRGANHYLRKRDLDILLENDLEVGIIAFEGGHQIPPQEHQIMAFQWLLDSTAVEELSTIDDLKPTPTPKLGE
jgi:predicted esterase